MKRDDFPNRKTLVLAQRQFFDNGGTRSLQARQCIQTLKQVILVEEEAINQALNKDLGKSSSETFLSEVGHVTELVSSSDTSNI